MTRASRLAAAVAAVAALAGCVTYERPEDLRPVSVAELRQEAAKRPDRTLRVLDRKWRGFHVRPDDSFFWVSRGTRIIIARTRVSSVQDNVICAAPAENGWLGGCFALLEDRDGRLFVEVEFRIRQGFFVLEDPLLVDAAPYLKRGI